MFDIVIINVFKLLFYFSDSYFKKFSPNYIFVINSCIFTVLEKKLMSQPKAPADNSASSESSDNSSESSDNSGKNGDSKDKAKTAMAIFYLKTVNQNFYLHLSLPIYFVVI
jgi:hypothetical protein